MSPKQRKQQPSRGPLYLILAGIILVTGVLIWLGVNQSGAPTSPTSVTSLGASLPFPSIERISVDQAKTALDNNDAVFVDVRDASSFKSGHIPGSVNIYLVDFEMQYTALSKDAWIILYCT